MNKLIIIGNLTADPESRTTQSGKQVCSFTVAVARKGNKEQTDFFRVSAWGETGNVCARYLSKGKKVAVTGQVSASAYQTKSGETRANLDVFAEDVEFLSPKGNDVSQGPGAALAGFVDVSGEQLPWE